MSTNDSRDLYGMIKDALPQFDSYLSKPYSPFEERLATFVSKNISVKEDSTFLLHDKTNVVVGGDETYTLSFMQHTRIGAGNRMYDICNLHGLWQGAIKDDTTERIEQSDAIIKLLDGFKGKKVLCGDFNLVPDAKSISMIEEAGMRNLVKDFKIKSTRSELAPAAKGKFADYIFISEDIEVKSFSVLDEVVSDHLPLYLEFD